MDESDFVCSFLDTHDDACACWCGWSSLVGDPIHYCTDDCCHLRLRMDFRAHLSLRCIDVRTKAWPGPTGEAGTDEIEFNAFRRFRRSGSIPLPGSSS